MRGELVSFDIESTGLDIQNDHIIEIGAVRMKDGEITGEFSALVDPGIPIPDVVTHITGIKDTDIKGAQTIHAVLPKFTAFVGDAPVIAHNVAFDIGIVRKHQVLLKNLPLDTYELAAILLPRSARYNLSTLVEHFQIELEHAHRALDDARATALLYWKLWERALQLPYHLLHEISQHAHHFTWDAGQFFLAATAEVQQQGAADDATPRSLHIFPPPPDDEPLEIGNRVEPLDVDATAALLDAQGAIAVKMPAYEHRPQQVDMVRAIAYAFNEKQHMLIEAGTGTGKSLAYLLPSALWATQNQQRVVIATNTINLQDQLINKDIPRLRDLLDDRPFKASVMKGRGNYLCPRRLMALRRRQPANLDEVRMLAKLLVWLHESPSGDRGEINLRPGESYFWSRLSAEDEGCTFSRCENQMDGTCPFHKARKAAEASHLVIVNHALLIADANTDNHVLPPYDYLIIDEAHQLEDAITLGMSVRLSQRRLLRRLEEIGGVSQGVLGDMLNAVRGDDKTEGMSPEDVANLESFVEIISGAVQDTIAHLRKFFKQVYVVQDEAQSNNKFGRSNQVRLEQHHRNKANFATLQTRWRYLSAFLGELTKAMTKLTGGLNKRQKVYQLKGMEDHINSINALAQYLQEVHDILEGFVKEPDANTIYWINAGQAAEDVGIQTAPLHIGPLMEAAVWQRTEATILTSATLRTQDNFDYISERLYADKVLTNALGSPFNYKESTLLYVPEDIPEPSRRGYQEAVEQGIYDLAMALKGRVLVLFTSYNHLRDTATSLTSRLALHGITVYDQASGSSRDAILDGFISTEKAVLFGTRSFWQGVDIPGQDLSALVITRLPFSVPSDPIFAARSETYESHFDDYAVPDAVLRFRQGFGRLIRTATDRGLVTIFDSRVVNKSYGMSFLESLPDCTIQQGSLRDLGKFAKKWLEGSLR